MVQTWVSDLAPMTLRRRYVICRPADRQVLARVQTRWVLVDLRVRKAIEVPSLVAANIHLPASPPPLPWQTA